MRILIVSPVTPYLPSHDGARAVVAHLVRNLGSVHTVGLVAATTPADTPEQRQWASGLCAWTRVVSAGRWRSSLSLQPGEGVARVRAAVLEAVRDFAPDVLHLEGSVLAPLARLGGLPTVLAVRDADTLPSPGERRRVRRPWSWIDGRLDEWQQAAWEHAWFQRADVVLTGDALPVGVDLELHEFRRTIFPKVRAEWARAELVLPGGDPARGVRVLGNLAGVRVTGVMPDLRPTLWSASVAVPTTRIGILEAMALGTPVVVSSRVAAAVSDVVPGDHVLIADDDAVTARALLAVLRDPELAERLAGSARAFVEARHGWPNGGSPQRHDLAPRPGGADRTQRMTPFLVAIAGGSGSGKSVLTQAVAAALGSERVATLAHDRYYRDRKDLLPIERSRLNYDVPDALDQALFREHLMALRLGQPIVPPVYCFVTHRRDGWGTPIVPREIVLIEGILLFHDPDIRNAFDVRIFVDAPDDVRLRRRISRDSSERGRTPDAVVAQCRGTVFPAHSRYVEPSRALADLVLLNAGRLEPVVEVATAVIRSQLARRPGGSGIAKAA